LAAETAQAALSEMQAKLDDREKELLRLQV
jgi:hypothetical protein